MSGRDKFPTQARVVIIGGGIVGCSTAYHLAKLGWSDVVLLEKHKLTSGSTFHAAGLVGQLRSNANVTRLLRNSVELYQSLENETGLATGWKQSGCLRLACNEARMMEYRRQTTTARSFGLEMEMLSASQCQDLWPIMDGRDVVGGCFTPSDGQANPSDITQALAKGARSGGVTIIEDCEVDGITLKNDRVEGVSTNQGDVTCDIVVNCAGQWAREIGQMAGVNVPLVSVEHQYMISEEVSGLARDMPTIRDPDRGIYFKEEVGGLVAGMYEPSPIPWAVDGIPKNFNFTLLDGNWDQFEPAIQQCLARVPALNETGIKELINGPEAFTPDGNFILGEAPNISGFFVGAGFNAFGIASGGGAGNVLAQWIIAGEAPMDFWPVDIRRFGQHYSDISIVRERTLELYAKHYSIAWPFEEHQHARKVKTSELYESLKEQGACFGEKMGWERPNWFAPQGTLPKDEMSFGRANWFEAVGREHRAVRERVGIFDQSSFAKFELRGADSEKALSWICSNDICKPVGAITYTQMLNSCGGIACDLTVTRLASDVFYIVTGTGFRTHDFSWINRNIAPDIDARLVDVTDDNFTLSLMGPMARAVLECACDRQFPNEEFPFGQCRQIVIEGASIHAMRVTYVGELGWELHGKKGDVKKVYNKLMQCGQKFEIVNAGYRAIESLRLEKTYRAWGADIGPDYTPYEAGLGWAVKSKTEIDFLGRTALLEHLGKPLNKMLVTFCVDDPAIILLGRETILRDGKRVGWLSSAGWGYTLETNIGLGYVRDEMGVDSDYVKQGSYELDIAGTLVPCKSHLTPLYDPKMNRVRG